MDNRREQELSLPLLGEESLVIRPSESYHTMGSDDSPVPKPTYLPLFLPGRVLHIKEDGPTRRCVMFLQLISESKYLVILIYLNHPV